MIYLVGNSHVNSLATCWETLGKPERKFMRPIFLGPARHEMVPFHRRRDRVVMLTSGVHQIKLRRATGRVVVDDGHVWAFTLGTHSGRLYQHPFWASAVAAAVNLPAMRPISQAVMTRLLAHQQDAALAFYGDLHAAGVPFVVFSAPWPRKDTRFVEGGIPIETILTISALANARLADWLGDRGIPFILPPEETRAEDGTLAPEFCRRKNFRGDRDPHHGNEAYGALMYPRVIAACRALDPDGHRIETPPRRWTRRGAVADRKARRLAKIKA